MTMAADPAEVLSLPKPAWAGEDVVMAYDMARRFLEAEIATHYDDYEKNEIVDQSAWKKAGAAGLLCASVPAEYGGAGGTFAHESMIAEAVSHVGVDANGRAAIEWGVYGVPETFIVGRDGKIAYKLIGAITPENIEKVLKVEIEKALKAGS